MGVEQYFYSGQIRRFLMQFIRAISGFQIRLSKNELGVETYQQVPVIYGDSSRQVANIIRGNSENTAMTAPVFAVYISELNYDRERVMNPTHISTLHLKERRFDPVSGTWTTEQGDSYAVERLMPVPYTLGITVDLWVTNTDQKLQLIEQISTLFNPALEIQNTDNYIDWTSLSAIFLESTNWSLRSVPVGENDSLDVCTYKFKLPIWLSPPAKVMKESVIHKIITQIYDENGDYDISIIDASNPNLMARRIVTPLNAHLIFMGNTLTLLREQDRVLNGDLIRPEDGAPPPNWQTLIALYGVLTPGYTQIRLWQEGTQTEVIGTVAYHPTDETKLLFTPYPDTIPVNNLAPINAIVDPMSMKVDSNITSPTVGYRLMILNAIGDASNLEGALAWRGLDGSDLIAPANSIIEFDGTRWVVSFNPENVPDIKYVTNLKTGTQYKFENGMWLKSIEGHYSNGDWRIVL